MSTEKPPSDKHKKAAKSERKRGSSKDQDKDKVKDKDRGKRDPKAADGKNQEKVVVDEKSGKKELESRLHDDAFCKAALSSHAGWMGHPLQTLSTSSSLSVFHSSLIAGTFLLFLLLIAPRQWVKYLTLPIFPLLPVQNTLAAIAADRKSKNRTKSDGAQWLFFWTAWVVLGWIGEMMRVFKPGYTNVWEITRVALAVGLGGPWLGRAALA